MSISKTSITCISILVLFITSCGNLNNGKLRYQKLNISSTEEKTKATDEALILCIQPSEQIQNVQSKNLPKINRTQLTPQEAMLVYFSFEDTIKMNKCDTILMKDGTKVTAKVIEIGPEAIKYKRCDNLDGPLYIKNTSDAASITYSNGTKDIIKSELKKTIATIEKAPRRPKVAIGGLVFGIVGLSLGMAFCILSGELLFLIAASLGFLAIVFAICSEVMRKKKPDSKLGRNLGIVSIILGGLSIVSLSVMFLTLLMF